MSVPNYGEQELRQRTADGLQPRLWEVRGLLAQLDNATALSDRLWREVEALQQELKNSQDTLRVMEEACDKEHDRWVESQRDLTAMIHERDSYKAVADEEARAGDEARAQRNAARTAADLNRNLATASAGVVEAARLLLDHDCQTCREYWDDAREAIVMQLAIAIDRLDGRTPRTVNALDLAPSESVQ